MAFSWEYWRWGSPIRSLIWDEDLFSPIAALLGWQWAEWVSSLHVDHCIKISDSTCSFIFLIAGFIAILYPRFLKNKKIIYFLILPTILLFLYAILKTKSHFGQTGQMLELTLQWATPIMLIIALIEKVNITKLIYLLKISIALTFLGHGLYAIGYYPVPGHFLDMTMNGLGFNNIQALRFLHIVGWLDVLAAFILFFPNRKWVKTALYYIIIWGFLTSGARLWSYLPFYSIVELSDQWLAESVKRWVHFLVPLSLWFLLKFKSLRRISLR